MSRVWCIVIIAVTSTCWAGATQADQRKTWVSARSAVKEAQKVTRPWWVVARGGGYTSQSMYGSDVGYLDPVDGPPGGIGLGFKPGLLVGVGGGRWFYRWLGVEVALSRFDVELGADDLLEETGEGISVEIGTCTLNAAQLTVLFGWDSGPEKALSGFVGIDLLYEMPGSFDLADAGQLRLGVVEVETRSALVWGFSIRGDVRLGRGPWALTLNSTMTVGGGEPFVVHIDPEAGYESSSVPFQPLTITIGFLRRF